MDGLICESNDCSNINLPGQSSLRIQYSTNGSTWVNSPVAGTRYIRFSTDGGVTWGNAVTLPVGEGATVLHYDTTAATSVGSATEQTIGTQYTMDNTPTPVMATNGDYLLMEAFFNITAAATGDITLTMKIGNASPASNSIATYTWQPLAATSAKLTCLFRRTAAATQLFESKVELYGPSNQIVSAYTNPINNATINLAADVYVQCFCNDNSQTIITFKYLVITLFEV